MQISAGSKAKTPSAPKAKEKARTPLGEGGSESERERGDAGAMRQRSPAVLQLRLWLLAVSVWPAFLGVLAADLSKGELSCSLLPPSLRFCSPVEILLNAA